jgi:hypothetical protein
MPALNERKCNGLFVVRASARRESLKRLLPTGIRRGQAGMSETDS